MTDAKDIAAAAEAVKGIVQAVPVYQDALQPAAKEIGRALTTVARAVNAALAPVGALVWGYDRICEYLTARVSQKLAATPEEHIQTPPANVAGPALEALRFAGETADLREMYASLLATAMDTRVSTKAHPAFVEIIKQLTPDEARILRAMANGQYRPIVSVLASVAQGGQRVVTRHQSMLDHEGEVAHPEMVPGYLDNLCRLGLTEIPPTLQMANTEAYVALEVEMGVAALQERAQLEGSSLTVERRLIRLTDLGTHFVYACILERQPVESSPPAA